MPRSVRFGLVGAGGVAELHLAAIKAVDGAELVGVASLSVEHARETGVRWTVPWTTDRNEILRRRDIDVIVITTPSGFHARMALEALDCGKHVIVEKPVAMSVAEVDNLVRVAADRQRWVAVIAQHRFDPLVNALREALDAGALGRVALIMAESIHSRPQSYYESAKWRGTLALDGGVLMNQAVHEVDLVCWFGGPVQSVAAHTATLAHEIEAPDTATISMRFAAGTLGQVVATTCAPPGFSRREVSAYGGAGHARIAGGLAVEWEIPGFSAREVGIPKSSLTGFGSSTATTESRGHERQYQDLVSAIRDQRPPALTVDGARAAIEVIEAAHKSNRRHGTVHLGQAKSA